MDAIVTPKNASAGTSTGQWTRRLTSWHTRDVICLWLRQKDLKFHRLSSCWQFYWLYSQDRKVRQLSAF